MLECGMWNVAISEQEVDSHNGDCKQIWSSSRILWRSASRRTSGGLQCQAMADQLEEEPVTIDNSTGLLPCI